MRSGDWVVLDLPNEKFGCCNKRWKVVEYPIFEEFFGFFRDSVKLYNKEYGELISPKKYLRYDNYPKSKIINKGEKCKK